MRLSGNKILITGGASGIGLGLARRFREEGNEVLICGRRGSALEAAVAEMPGIVTRTADVSTPAGRIELFDWIAKEHPETNVLVNNAGIQQWMSIEDEDFYERAEIEIATNIEAPVHLTAMFVKLDALDTIINVTSGLSFAPLAKTPVYSATKAFFHSFTLSLRHNLKPKGIEVIEIIPPAINTDLGGKGLHDFAPPVSEFIASIFEQLKQGKNELTFGLSEKAANAGPAELRNIFNILNPVQD